MTAAYITEPGPPESIVVGPLPVPEPGPGELLVRTQAMAVNHVDTFIRSGQYATPLPSPFIIGRDLAGTVAALGAGVTGFAVGQRVWCNSLGHGGRQGSFAEYAVVVAGASTRCPTASTRSRRSASCTRRPPPGSVWSRTRRSAPGRPW